MYSPKDREKRANLKRMASAPVGSTRAAENREVKRKNAEAGEKLDAFRNNLTKMKFEGWGERDGALTKGVNRPGDTAEKLRAKRMKDAKQAAIKSAREAAFARANVPAETRKAYNEAIEKAEREGGSRVEMRRK
jgi:hypothetical protein